MSLNSSFFDGPVVSGTGPRRLTPRAGHRLRSLEPEDRVLDFSEPAVTPAAGPPPAAYAAPVFYQLQQSPSMA